MRIGFIGGGNMAEAMIKGMTSHGMKGILVSDPSEKRRLHLKDAYGVEITASNEDVVSSSSIIILAVKPQVMAKVLDEVGVKISEDRTVVSIAAGISLSFLAERIRSKKLIRVMPNTPALVQEGMTVVSLCECLSDGDMSVIREVFMSIGKVITLPEKYMDIVTALSGSGPGFISLFVEAAIQAGIRRGLGEDDATALMVQTLLGTARLLETGISPVNLRNMVTSPGGTTAAGLEVLTREGFTEMVSAAVDAAARRSEELGRGKA
jgi:pyrroline-5-carboxylate reductase